MEQIENLQDLQETLFRKGFPVELIEEVIAQVTGEEVIAKAVTGEFEFSVDHMTKIKDDEMGYRLHFKADVEHGKVYLNSYDAAFLNAPDGVREQNISSNTLITAAEAHRMLKHGTLVAVNKDLFNKERVKYNVWLSFDVSGPKDEYGNYPVASYHENYYKKRAFDVKDSLQDLPVPVKELEAPHKLDDFAKALTKANIISVTILHNGQEQPGHLCINPKVGKVDVYDANMKLIESEQQKVNTSKTATQQAAKETKDVKKKSWGKQQGVTWNQKGQQHKGMST